MSRMWRGCRAKVILAAIMIGSIAAGWATAGAEQEATVQKPAGGQDVERAPGVTDTTVGSYQERQITVRDESGEATFRYRVLAPANIRPGSRYPVVLFLHGAGERGADNLRQLKYLPVWMAEPAMREKHPCFLIAPQCREGRRWVDVNWADRESSPQPPSPGADLAAAIAALDAVLTREACDPERVYLTGLSMGGYGTWDLAARMPDRWAAAVPICGGGDEKTAPRLVGLPLWAFHGDADKAVPVERSRTMVTALKAAGGSPRYSEFPGVGHDSWTPAYRDPALLEWLFSQRRNRPR